MKNPKNEKSSIKKTITIDITEWYDKIKEISKKEIRSIEEQCRFFIKNGIENKCENSFYANIEYRPSIISSPYKWEPEPLSKQFPDSSYVYCNSTATNDSGNSTVNSKCQAVDCEFDSETGVYHCS